ncbi:MAG: phage tail assembly protein [Zoogloeaceae bacterium]|nr:phage tail assembly protein [Zoogloeaceae bacterium]
MSTARITLSQPVHIDGQDVTDFELREPLAGDLRRVKMLDLIQLVPEACAPVIETISRPMLPEASFYALPARDAAKLMGGLAGFFGE